MSVAAITVMGVVGTALFAMIFMQFQNLREDMRQGFRDAKADNKALEQKLTGDMKAQGDKIEAQGDKIEQVRERLARIEAVLGIHPPAEAA